jgi:hypothetical protein
MRSNSEAESNYNYIIKYAEYKLIYLPTKFKIEKNTVESR